MAFQETCVLNNHVVKPYHLTEGTRLHSEEFNWINNESLTALFMLRCIKKPEYKENEKDFDLYIEKDKFYHMR